MYCHARDFLRCWSLENPQSIKQKQVNIYDVTEALDNGTVARNFEHLGGLALYMQRELRIMELKEAKSKRMFRVFVKKLPFVHY